MLFPLKSYIKNNRMMKSIVLKIFLLLLMAGGSLTQAQQADWPSLIANDVYPYEASGMSHGPMLGRPGSHSMRVWIRTTGPMEFKVICSESLPLDAGMDGQGGQTLKENDFTGFVDLTGLNADTKYYYGIVIDGRIADTRMDPTCAFPSFRTLPDEKSYRDEAYNPEGLFNFSFGTSFGNRQGKDRFNDPAAYYSMMRTHPELSFFLMNGDYIYEETRTSKNRPHTTDMFRDDYKIYMERGRGMSRMFRHVPSLFMYDDHESYSDLEGTGEIGLKDGKWLYRDLSLKPFYEYAGWANMEGPHYQPTYYGTASVRKGSGVLEDTEVDFTAMRREAISNIHVDMGQKNSGVYQLDNIIDAHHIEVSPPFTASEKPAYSVGTRHYFDFKVSNCHFFIADIRSERTRYIPEKAHDEDRFLLGETQKKWLMEGIAQSDGDFIVVMTTVSWMIYHTNFHMYAAGLSKGEPKLVNGRSVKEDGFTGAVKERDELLDFFDELEKPVIILTGDLHNAYMVQIHDNVWECMLGPINSGNHNLASAGNPPMGGWFNSEGTDVKIKWLASFPNTLAYTRLRNNYYGIITVNNILKTAREEGAGKHFVAYEEPQLVVQVYDAYTGKLVYAEGISTVDAKKKGKAKMPSVR